MKTASIVLSLILFLGNGAAIAMDQIIVSGTWRYRITVTVETPEGVKFGSAVRQVSNSDMKPRILDLPDVGNPAEVVGEAVVVDLGERGKLFALISDRSSEELYRAFHISGATTFDGIKALNAIPVGAMAPLENQQFWPKIVMFKDINDPMSVHSVNAANVTALLGPGTKLSAISIERTDDPLTWGIVDKHLPDSFEQTIIHGWRDLPKNDRNRIVNLITFKRGSP